MEEIKVSIWCTAYNHKEYIERAIKGFLSQRTTFKYDIHIHDDASTDGTTELIREYENNYPELIHLYCEEENQYQKGCLGKIKSEIVQKKMKGKYIAWCEGDDWWIDNNKLQLQVDYMDAHEECIMTAHNGLWMDDETKEITIADGFDKEKDITIEEIIVHKKGCFPTASVVVRREFFLPNYPFDQCKIGDWPLQLSCSNYGIVHYFDRVMSVYTSNRKGSWTCNTRNMENSFLHTLDMIRYLRLLDEFWKYRYTDTISSSIEYYAVSEARRLGLDYKSDETEKLFNKYEIGEFENEVAHLRERVAKLKSAAYDLIEFAKSRKHLIIMGCGEYGEFFHEFLNQKDIRIDGFAVSNNQAHENTFKGHPVWKLADIPFNKDEYGIIIGIGKNLKSEIEKSLKSNDVQNYFWPSI